MLFHLPHPPLSFEIPDEWWREAAMEGFVAQAECYRVQPCAHDDVESPPIREVAPIIRTPETTLDWRGFRRERMVRILQGFRTDAALPPVDVVRFDAPSIEGYRYRLVDGCHRFYASVAAGFSKIPARLVLNFRRLPSSPFSGGGA